MSVVLIFQDYRYRLIMKFFKVRLRIPIPLPRLPQAKRERECEKSRIGSDRAGNSTGKRKPQRDDHGVWLVGSEKNHSLLFSLALCLSFFVRDSTIFSRRQAEEGGGKIWESVIGKNCLWRLRR